ncbi:DUF3857 domain-containing protein [Flavihumibacter petaseus]|uniref:DUF3857 domain-containing protein n=1 Tax=Flavihumibacter petaseus NBRC 106054 TaxID=1220578 RepID=A0A0E9N528_9BACT|nr:DUF3857 domain-containing protein [Flavihumibacter petaseus]GAO44445.1 hypothetical protein FPE01S_03_04820 [Flavihumibacter petaseus NBRC 106054]
MVKQLSLILTLLFAGMLLSAQTAGPAPQWLLPVTPENRQEPSAREVSDGYYLPLVEFQVNIPQKTSYRHFKRKIVNASGVQAASEISVQFHPEYEKVIYHQVKVIRNGNTMSRLSNQAIRVTSVESEADNYQYNNIKRTYIILEDIQAGDEIDYAYSVVGQNPVFRNYYAATWYFCHDTPISNYFLLIQYDAARKLNVTCRNGAAQPVEGRSGKLQTYEWRQPALSRWNENTAVPSWYENDPVITVTNVDNWKTLNNWALDVFHQYNYPPGPALRNKIAAWKTAAAGDTAAYAVNAIRYVQDNIRYLGFEVGVYSHQPHHPDDVFQKGYGDCKDKALLLVRLLREGGIPAWIALVNSSLEGHIENEAPSTGLFDHAIVALEYRGKQRFIDATSQYQRGGLEEIYVKDYGNALVVKPGNESLSPVTGNHLYSNKITETIEVLYPENGESRLEVRSEFEGGYADAARRHYHETSQEETRQHYEEYYGAIYDSVTLSEDIGFTDDSAQNRVVITESYTIPKLWTVTEGKQSFSLFAKTIYDQLTSLTDHKMNTPLALSFPAKTKYQVVVKMPEKWNIHFSPVLLHRDNYDFEFTSSTAGKTIMLDYQYESKNDHLAPEDLFRYKKDFKAMEEVMQSEIYQEGKFAGTQATSITEWHWPAVIVCLMVFGGMIPFLLRYNQRFEPGEFTGTYPLGVDLWTGLLGLSIVTQIVVLAAYFVANEAFNPGIMDAIRFNGSLGRYYTILTELALRSMLLCMSVASLFWFFMKRDIFPRFMLLYISASVGVNVLLCVLYYMSGLADGDNSLFIDALRQTVRSIIWGAVWGAYLYRSDRVKQVFVNIHPDNA